MTMTIVKPALSPAAATFMTKDLKLFIDGKWVAAKSGKTIAVEDPATEETIAHVSAGEKADIDLAVAAARRAFESGPWSNTACFFCKRRDQDDAAVAAPLKNVRRSALIWSALVAGMPRGKPG